MSREIMKIIRFCLQALEKNSPADLQEGHFHYFGL